ncbi:MAG: hypothetical protein IANPNBLG_01391 [Bryobacteraceae bacterium]|nr:hypothetical protein [Bryobacteraceae bacterium]
MSSLSKCLPIATAPRFTRPAKPRSPWHLALLLSVLALPAQVPTAELTGIVTDVSGALVAGAEVSITANATNIRRVVTTNAAGVYIAPALQPGAYSVKVTMKGFRSAMDNTLELQVGQTARLNFELQIGDVAETVEVSAAAENLDTETTTVGTVIDNRRIEDLPLNGRNYLQLANLVPSGTIYGPGNFIAGARGGGARAQFTLNLSGQRFQFNRFTLDGVENTDPNFGTYLFLPSVDALQEFKVETGTYSAEFGRNVTQVNVITKSGTNQLHGSLFEFVRNTAMDARNFFQLPNAPVQPLKRNQFGFTLGGPVVIPKVMNGRNKLFFFVNYEGQRQRTGSLQFASVPLPEYFTGNFAGLPQTVYDPSTRVLNAAGTAVVSQQPFPGNVIPQNRIHPSSIVARPLWPVPNSPPAGVRDLLYAQNYQNNLESMRADSDGGMIRGDWQQNDRSSFQLRYSHSYEPYYTPQPIAGQGIANTSITDQAMLGHTFVLNPTMVNQFKLGFSRLDADNGNLHANDPDNDWVKKLKIPYVLTSPRTWGSPRLGIGPFTVVGDPENSPYSNWDTMIQVTNNFSWSKGKHTLKFGGDYVRTRYNLGGNDRPRGQFTFSGTYSQLSGQTPLALHGMSDYLLGLISAQQAQLGEVAAQLRGYSLGLYFQDNWKVSPKLTLNLGLRYELSPGWVEKYDHMTIVSWSWDNSFHPIWVRAGTGDFYEGNPPVPLPAGWATARDGRFGRRSWKTDARQFGPRVGFAYSLNSKTVLRGGFGVFFPHDIGNAAFDILRNQPFTMRIASNSNQFIPNATWDNPYPPESLRVSTLSPSWLWGEPQPYTPQWSFNIQRGLTGSLTLEAGYVGSASVHLQRTVYANDSAPGGPIANRNLRRPWPDLGFIQAVEAPSHASYHSFQTRLQQRFSRGFTLLASYSWEKSIDDGSGIRQALGDTYVPSNGADLRTERGLSAFNFGQKLTVSTLWELPIGRGKAVGKDINRYANLLIGGWQLGGIFTISGGFPFSVSCQNNGTYQNTDSTCRADATGISPKIDNPGPARWFNPAAFTNRVDFVTNVGPYRFGNSARNNIVGPGMVQLDASLFKSFRFRERAELDFRAEFFNLPNHPNFGQPAATVGVASFAIISGTRTDQRQIQLGLRLTF